jgi:hypothetical protein
MNECIKNLKNLRLFAEFESEKVENGLILVNQSKNVNFTKEPDLFSQRQNFLPVWPVNSGKSWLVAKQCNRVARWPWPRPNNSKPAV